MHTSQQLGRGLGDDVDLLVWLREVHPLPTRPSAHVYNVSGAGFHVPQRIWPYESSLTEADQYASTLLCCAELVRSGVTCFAEAGGQHVHKMAEAVVRSAKSSPHATHSLLRIALCDV